MKCNELHQCPITGQCEIIKRIKEWQFFRLDVMSLQTNAGNYHAHFGSIQVTIINWNFTDLNKLKTTV